MKNLYLDNNVWNYFAKNEVDLMAYFPKSDFKIFITKQGDYELDQINNRHDEQTFNIKKYAQNCIKNELVFVDPLFGFLEESIPKNEQRTGGFLGRFTSVEEENMRVVLNNRFRKEKKRVGNIVFQQEADIELGVRSTKGIVVTFDKKVDKTGKPKPSPLREAKNRGGKVVFLDQTESLELSMNEFMVNLIEQLNEMETTSS